MAHSVVLIPVAGMPEVRAGDDLPELIAAAVGAGGGRLVTGDVVVVTHKVVSKAEGRLVQLAGIEPSEFATNIAEKMNKDPREVEVILRESARIVKMAGRVLICETHHGFVCANAGVDHSNVETDVACLLPVDPDASARRIGSGLASRTGASVAVVITDTFGRPWRTGQTNIAIGLAGMAALTDYRGQSDSFGRGLKASVLAVADEIAGAAELVMGKTDRVPVAIVRGYSFTPAAATARDLVRNPGSDLFR